jgi:hypothetical protein
VYEKPTDPIHFRVIAILLGRLDLGIDEYVATYLNFSRSVFSTSQLPQLKKFILY